MGEQIWLKIVGEFYKVCLSRTHKLLGAQELKRLLSNERINVARGEEVKILKTWARVSFFRPNVYSMLMSNQLF